MNKSEGKLIVDIDMFHMSLVMRKPAFCTVYAKTKTQISFAVTFVFATRIVQSLYFLNPKFQVSNNLLRVYSPVCVRPGQKPQGSFETHCVGFETSKSAYSVASEKMQ